MKSHRKQPEPGKSGPWMPSTVALRAVETLIPYARNARTHSAAQVAQIAASIREFGWTAPVLVAADGTIIAGHGRVLAARQLGLVEVPTIELGHLSETQRRALVLADNQLALTAGWDDEMLATELRALLDDGFALPVLGFDDEVVTSILRGDGVEGAGADDGLSDQYTKKIVVPTYEPHGPCPPVSALYDEGVTTDLIAEINRAEIPEDVRAYLLAAATRHTKFNFRNAAEFYAHATPEVQSLMERSALVLIDFDAAVENGFVKLTKILGELADAEAEDGDA